MGTSALAGRKLSAAAVVGSEAMYGHDEKDLCGTLSQMHKTAIERANFNQVEAKEILRGYVQADRRKIRPVRP